MQQEIPAGKQELSIFLTDDPAFFDQVLIDIRSVAVLVDTCDHHRRGPGDDRGPRNNGGNGPHHCEVWDSLAIVPGVYDLLSLRNGVDTMFAFGFIPDGKIKKIRVELGTNNALVKDNITYPLNLPQGWNPTITIELKGGQWDEFEPRRLRVWLDFDAGRSILVIRDGHFVLRPVIHAFTPKSTGTIEGKVEPRDATAVISVFNATDTAFALPGHDGKFKVRGLEEGSYTVFFNGYNGYSDTTISNVEVRKGKPTKLKTVRLDF